VNIETEISPPDVDHDYDEDRPSARIACILVGTDDVSYDAAIQLFGESAEDPEDIANALLGAALALGQLRGPDVGWAVMQRFASYDGVMTR
jgi:hypothetical protein